MGADSAPVGAEQWGIPLKSLEGKCRLQRVSLQARSNRETRMAHVGIQALLGVFLLPPEGWMRCEKPESKARRGWCTP